MERERDRWTVQWCQTAESNAAFDAKLRNADPTYGVRDVDQQMVPVFAEGPGAEEFLGIYENTAIFDKMKALLNL